MTSAPHSRACGWLVHPHGDACAADCPTCNPVGTPTRPVAGTRLRPPLLPPGADEPTPTPEPLDLRDPPPTPVDRRALQSRPYLVTFVTDRLRTFLRVATAPDAGYTDPEAVAREILTHLDDGGLASHVPDREDSAADRYQPRRLQVIVKTYACTSCHALLLARLPAIAHDDFLEVDVVVPRSKVKIRLPPVCCVGAQIRVSVRRAALPQHAAEPLDPQGR